MTTRPLVSIALCTYNGEKYLEEQLVTIFAQTYSPIEVIAVDDCSQDRTVEILQAYAKTYPALKIYRNEKNLGYVKNFERAIGYCHGELIALCDQDDSWHQDKIALQVAAMGNNVLVYHDSEFVDEDGKALKKMSDVTNLYRGNEPEAFLLFNCISGHCMLAKREVLEKAIPFKPDFYHDWWIAYVAANLGSIDYVPKCLDKYRQHGNSDTNMLKIDRVKTDPNSALSLEDRLQKQLAWLKYCANFKYNKNSGVVNKMVEIYDQRLHQKNNPELVMFLVRKIRLLFGIQKKPLMSKLNFIRKQYKGLGN